MKVKLSKKSLDALKEIKDIIEIKKMLDWSISFGNIFSIVSSNSVASKSVVIAQSDFDLLFNSISSLNKIQYKLIFNIASYRMIDTIGEERQFWEHFRENIQPR